MVTSKERQTPPAAARFGREVCDAVAIGPLGGVATALRNCPRPMLVVTTVDMPAVRREHLNWLVEELRKDSNAAALMVQRNVDGRTVLEPFPLVCRREFLGTVEKCLAGGERSMRGLVGLPGMVVLEAPGDWPADVWTNLNTPLDLQQYIAAIKPSGSGAAARP